MIFSKNRVVCFSASGLIYWVIQVHDVLPKSIFHRVFDWSDFSQPVDLLAISVGVSVQDAGNGYVRIDPMIIWSAVARTYLPKSYLRWDQAQVKT